MFVCCLTVCCMSSTAVFNSESFVLRHNTHSFVAVKVTMMTNITIIKTLLVTPKAIMVTLLVSHWSGFPASQLWEKLA